MLRTSFKRRCFPMLVLESIARLKKHTILGKFVTCNILLLEFQVLIYAYHCSTDISFTGYFCAHSGGGLKMIGIIMETRGWTWQVLYLVVSLEWFVSQVIVIILLIWSCYLVSFYLLIPGSYNL